MKITQFKIPLIASLIGLIALPASAAALKLLKQVPPGDVDYPMIGVNFTAMTGAGLGSYQKVKNAVVHANPGKSIAESGDAQIAFIKPYGDGRAGVVHHVNAKPDGTVVQAAFEIPRVHSVPKETQIWMNSPYYRPSVGFNHVVETNAGQLKWGQTYTVEKINGKAVRTTTYEIKDTPEVRTTARLDRDDGKLVISIYHNKTQQLANADLKPDLDGVGRTIGFTMTTGGRELRIYSLNEKNEVIESIFELQINRERPVAFHTAGIDHKFRARNVLGKDEIERLGFFKAEIKTYAGRKTAGEAGATARGMHVNSPTESTGGVR